MGRRPIRVCKALGRLALLSILGAVVLAFGVPLVVRGPRFGWVLGKVLDRWGPVFCGKLIVQGGGLTWTLVPDLILGRALGVRLDGLRLLSPAPTGTGETVVDLRRVQAQVRIRVSPLRIDVQSLQVDADTFRLLTGQGHVGLMAALRPAPSRAEAGRCLPPSPLARRVRAAQPLPHRTTKDSGLTASVTVNEARITLRELVLDFPDWALKLQDVGARGGFSLGIKNGVPDLRFSVRDLDAVRGGTLRVGRSRLPWSTTVPFDGVRIGLVGVDDNNPADLVLQVDSGQTGRSILSGKARFSEVFAWQSRGQREWLDVDVNWGPLSDVMGRTSGRWKSAVASLPLERLSVQAGIHGPYMRVSTRVGIRGDGIEIDGHLDPDLEATVSARFVDVQTQPYLPASLRPFFAGILSGQVSASGRLGTSVQRMTADLDDVDVTLMRARPGPFPKTVRMARSTEGSEEPGTLTLASASVAQGRLQVRGVRAGLRGAEVRADATMTIPRAGKEPDVQATFDLTKLDLSRVLPGQMIGGKLSIRAALRGQGDDLRIDVAQRGNRTVTVRGWPLVVPEQMTARVSGGDELWVDRISVVHPGGGAIQAYGKVVFDRDIAAHVSVEAVPLSILAGTLPRGLVAGRLDGAFEVTGKAVAPSVAGQVALSGVRVGGILWGDGGMRVWRAPDGKVNVAGQVANHIVADAQLSFGSQNRLQVKGAVSVKDLPVGSALMTWAPSSMQIPSDLLMSGTGSLAWTSGQPVQGQAQAQVRGRGIFVETNLRTSRAVVEATAQCEVDVAVLRMPGLRAAQGRIGIAARIAGEITNPLITSELKVVSPLVLVPEAWPMGLTVPTGRLAFDGARIRVHDLSVASFGGTARLSGTVLPHWSHLDESYIETSRLEAQVQVEPVARFWPQALVRAKGRIDLDLQAQGRVNDPSLDGRIDFDQVWATPAAMRPWFLGGAIGIARGRIDLSGRRLTTNGLMVSLPVGGAVTVGEPGRAASVFWGPRGIESLSIPLQGQGLSVMARTRAGWGRVEQGAFKVTASRADAQSPLVVKGNVVAQKVTVVLDKTATFELEGTVGPGKKKSSWSGPSRVLVAGEMGLSVGQGELRIPWLPDPSFQIDCAAQGQIQSPVDLRGMLFSGNVRGQGFYSDLVLWVTSMASGVRIGRCQVR